MNKLNVTVNIKNSPTLDPMYLPLHAYNQAFLKTAKKPFALALLRPGDLISVFKTRIHGTSDMQAADEYYVDRLLKALLWQKGGYKVYVCGDQAMFEFVRNAYKDGGTRQFDANFMARVYEHPFEVEARTYDGILKEYEQAEPIGRHLDGCRIGFDAGGSDRKVSAVIDGEVVFSEEVVWQPTTNPNPDYHFEGIVSAFRAAASHMPRVDAIGVSSAGIYVNNRTMVASLFLKIPEDAFEQKVKDIYIRAAKEIGDVPLAVCNDGDVSALAGAMGMDAPNLLGLAMGTSEAGGYVDRDASITGWLNELAFVPIDANPDALQDEWSLDIGCGRKYFSQDSIIKLCPNAGIDVSSGNTPAEKLMIVQKLMQADDPRAAEVYRNVGIYLGHTVPLYESLYSMDYVLLLGRVMSGKGGDLIVSEAERVLREEYPECKAKLLLPDEKTRRVGQSVAAASLPETHK